MTGSENIGNHIATWVRTPLEAALEDVPNNVPCQLSRVGDRLDVVMSREKANLNGRNF
jgi:hypothetical protein